MFVFEKGKERGPRGGLGEVGLRLRPWFGHSGAECGAHHTAARIWVERTRCRFRRQEASLPGTGDQSTDVVMCWAEAEITARSRSPGAAELAAGLWRRRWRRGLF